MNQEQPIELVSHDGKFHADDVLAGAFLKMHFSKLGYKVIFNRSRDAKYHQPRPNRIIFDVGGVYNPNKRQFDHHQNNFNEKYDKGAKTIMSSFGLVFKQYNYDCVKALRPDIKFSKTDLNEICTQFYNNFVVAIDAGDNGINYIANKSNGKLDYTKLFTQTSIIDLFKKYSNILKPSEDNTKIYRLFYQSIINICNKQLGDEVNVRFNYRTNLPLGVMISQFNCIDTIVANKQNDRYIQAVEWAETIVKLSLTKVINSRIDYMINLPYFMEAVKDQETQNILFIDKPMNTARYLKDFNFSQFLFYVTPYKKKWRLHAINLPGSFKLLVPIIPDKMIKLNNVKYEFAHKNNFVAEFYSKEDALKIANISINIHQSRANLISDNDNTFANDNNRMPNFNSIRNAVLQAINFMNTDIFSVIGSIFYFGFSLIKRRT